MSERTEKMRQTQARYYQRHKENINTKAKLRRILAPKRFDIHYTGLTGKASQKACSANYALSVKTSAINMYSNGDASCKWCKQADMDMLCLDHIKNDGKNHRLVTGKKGMYFYKYLRDHDYPIGLQVLCYNCNIKKERCRARGENFIPPTLSQVYSVRTA